MQRFARKFGVKKEINFYFSSNISNVKIERRHILVTWQFYREYFIILKKEIGSRAVERICNTHSIIWQMLSELI